MDEIIIKLKKALDEQYYKYNNYEYDTINTYEKFELTYDDNLVFTLLKNLEKMYLDNNKLNNPFVKIICHIYSSLDIDYMMYIMENKIGKLDIKIIRMCWNIFNKLNEYTKYYDIMNDDIDYDVNIYCKSSRFTT